MKKFSPPRMKEVSLPTPHTLTPTPSFKSEGQFKNLLKKSFTIRIVLQ